MHVQYVLMIYVISFSLQILSSRLVPAGDQEKDESSAQLFRRNFLESGGLKSVINVLQRNALPSHVDLSVRQDCYAIALALSRSGGRLSPALKLALLAVMLGQCSTNRQWSCDCHVIVM